MIFMILSVFIWFVGFELMVNVSLLQSLGCCQVKLIFRGLTNKARQSYRGEFVG